jgi:hypothetical protein
MSLVFKARLANFHTLRALYTLLLVAFGFSVLSLLKLEPTVGRH